MKDDYISSLGVIKLMITPTADNPLPSDGANSSTDSDKKEGNVVDTIGYAAIAVVGAALMAAYYKYEKMKKKVMGDPDLDPATAPFTDFYQMYETYNRMLNDPRHDEVDEEYKFSKRAEFAKTLKDRRANLKPQDGKEDAVRAALVLAEMEKSK